MNYCHLCQHARPTLTGMRCAKRFALTWVSPTDSRQPEYGHTAVRGCGKSFQKRTPDYYRTKRTLTQCGRKTLKQAHADKRAA